MEYGNEAGWFDISNIYVIATFTFFFVPVTLASLKFGMSGAIPTALWLALLATPNIFIWHDGVDRLAEGAQFLTIIAFAIVVASRVDREVAERREARLQITRRRISEAKYRYLFEAAGEAILVFDRDGVIQEANVAAGKLFQVPPSEITGSHLDALIGTGSTKQLIEAADEDSTFGLLSLTQPDSEMVWLEPTCSQVFVRESPVVYQVMLRDATRERQRQDGLETYARRIIQAQEEERRRVARDIHDSTLQSVILLYRQLDQMETMEIGGSLTDDLKHRLHAARDQAETIADELRHYSRDLRPSILDDLGLVAALRWLIKDLEQRHDIHARFVVTGQRERLSPDAELGLFRVVQESLRNVERHSNADNVEVCLQFEPNNLTITVRDDGRGFVIESMPKDSGEDAQLGILGMRERVRLLGGDFPYLVSGRREHRNPRQPADPTLANPAPNGTGDIDLTTGESVGRSAGIRPRLSRAYPQTAIISYNFISRRDQSIQHSQ